MNISVGLRDVQWMTHHWPRLSVIMGMDEYSPYQEARQWLQYHCRRIELREPL